MSASEGRPLKAVGEVGAKPPTQRFRVNVPPADEAVTQWMAAQYNHSLSLRILIREEIQRSGFVDAMNRPVAQLPKRGRPAGAEEQREPEAELSPEPAPAAPAPEPTAVPGAVLDLDPEPPAREELLGIALGHQVLSPAQQTPASPALPPEPSADGPMDINDIFASSRRGS